MNPDYKDMLSALNGQEVEYLLVGAYALAVHGVPRATGDIDFWVKPSRENSVRVYKALATFGAPLEAQNISVGDFSEPDIVFQIGVTPNRIDILTKVSGLTFEEAWDNKKTTEIDGMTIHVIGREDFIRNKKCIGRKKDLADVAYLEEEE